MNRMMLWAGAAAGLFVGAHMLRSAGPAQPVLVELFTSEGCSSCPPADALLERLDQEQPVAGAQVIVVSEHVDYWNRLGWADPYSLAECSARQEQYARRFRLDGPYTPQMVVDGRQELLGSDANAATAAIRAALREPRVAVRIATAADGSASIEAETFPAGQYHKANVFLARVAETGDSNVLRGENRGRHLRHVAILRELRQLGKLDERAGFHARVNLTPDAGAAHSRWIAFVQEPDTGRVWGAAILSGPRS
jgi:hypothetical protein